VRAPLRRAHRVSPMTQERFFRRDTRRPSQPPAPVAPAAPRQEALF